MLSLIVFLAFVIIVCAKNRRKKTTETVSDINQDQHFQYCWIVLQKYSNFSFAFYLFQVMMAVNLFYALKQIWCPLKYNLGFFFSKEPDIYILLYLRYYTWYIFTCLTLVWGVCVLTHWGRATHICVGNLIIIGSDNGLSPRRHQAII